jgi:DMSO/TMAO reductase YedYZ molybdopterin-dependent catalytic subunit
MKYRNLLFMCFILISMAFCYAGCGVQNSFPEPTKWVESVCDLPIIIPPTPPATIPGYAKLDETTNLHVTGTMQEIDVETYRQVITGTAVSQPLSLTYDDLRCMPKREVRSVLTCPGFFEDEATWAGVPLEHILDLAGVYSNAEHIRLKGADGYSMRLNMDVIRDTPRSIIAYEWEGESLPILHGFPVRAVFPGQQGNTWVKWLLEIRVE